MSLELNSLGQPLGRPVPGWRPPARPSRDAFPGRFCLLIRTSSQAHAEELHAALANDREGRIWTYLPYGPFPDVTGYRLWMESVEDGDDPLLFTICDARSARAVGLAGYLRIDPEAGSIEVGHLAYSPLLQRTPAATEAMYLMMERAFRLGYRRYEWKCDALNEASRRAALRLGFTFEGVFRQARVVRGRNRDTAWFSVLDEEWPALREAFQRWLSAENFDSDGRQIRRLADFRPPPQP